jgi:predicted XRE-type DNA-binding protein
VYLNLKDWSWQRRSRPATSKGRRSVKTCERTFRNVLRNDTHAQIAQTIYPERKATPDVLTRRITTKKLRALKQAKLASVLGISQPQVSVLFKRGTIRQYIVEAGKRDALLLLLQKTKASQ